MPLLDPVTRLYEVPPVVPATAPTPPASAGSFSHGFLRCGFCAAVACPSRTVFGISLIPGMGCPVVMSSTIRWNEVGYGACGSAELVCWACAIWVAGSVEDGMSCGGG
jgi:hypothetical protein